jgi:hypothetical protein
MIDLYRGSTPLTRDSTTAAGTFSLTVPPSDSVLVIADEDSEEDIVYAYRMVNARTNVNFELDMSHGDCSAALIAPEDSILDKAIHDHVVAPNGDTIKYLGGHMMDAGASEVYDIDHYLKNSAQYIRIRRIIGRKPDGNPVLVTRARLRLPPMYPTEVVTEAFCEINGKPDPSILGLTSTFGDSVDYHARRAWRFDRATETLREIPAAGVTCSPITADPD